jgi:hypothetical protein
MEVVKTSMVFGIGATFVNRPPQSVLGDLA